MKFKASLFFLVLIACLQVTGCNTLKYDEVQPEVDERRIYLYGEQHGQELIIQKELELWNSCYHEYGMRHLFTEISYPMAQYLNIWMNSDDNSILDMIYKNLEGTLSHTQSNYNFYIYIKKNCPETVFHGTDVGHQYWSTGESYLEYLREKGMENSVEYELTLENAEQAQKFYGDGFDADVNEYRELCMIENFKREFSQLPPDEKIMGIYGSAHTVLGLKNWKSRNVYNMATQLDKYYRKMEGVGIYTLNISNLR